MAQTSIFEDARIRALMKSKMKRQEKHVPSVPTEALDKDDVEEVRKIIDDTLQHREDRDRPDGRKEYITSEKFTRVTDNLRRDITMLHSNVAELERAQRLVADLIRPLLQHIKQGDAAPPPEYDGPSYTRTMGENDDDEAPPHHRSAGLS